MYMLPYPPINHTPTAVSHCVQDGANSVLALDMEESEVVVQDYW